MTEVFHPSSPPIEPPMKPSHAQIAIEANKIWKNNGEPEGTALTDWFTAEKALTAYYNMQGV